MADAELSSIEWTGTMSNQFTPIVPPVSINLQRGLKGMIEGIAARLPHGQAVLNAGLRDVVHRAIDQSPDLPKGEHTLVSLAERLGILNPYPSISSNPAKRNRRRR